MNIFRLSDSNSMRQPMQLITVVLLSYMLISPAYGDLITAHDGFLGEGNQQATELELFNEELTPSADKVSPQQSDAEILRALDDFGGELNDDFLLKNSATEAPLTGVLSTGSAINDNSLLDDVISDDSFGDLDLGEILIDQQIDSEDQMIDNAELLIKPEFQMKSQGVGVNGAEEALINKLDNSDLMDFDKDLDIWGEELLNKKELLPSATDVKPLAVDDIELIDEINGIDGTDFE